MEGRLSATVQPGYNDMRIGLGQLICLILGVSFLSLGGGLAGGRMAARKQVDTAHEPSGATAVVTPQKLPAAPQISHRPAASTKNNQTSLPKNRKKNQPTPSVKADANLRYVSPSKQGERSRVVGSKYMIQAISTSDHEDAGTARKKLMAEGFPAGIFEADLGERGKWYRVYVGPYDSDEEAQSAVKAVHRIPGFEASFVKSLD